uniref:Uncharacterized protein n=1 Tax=Arundo donax TaxID=35708 RepID=A0A0A8Y708_ARUDO
MLVCLRPMPPEVYPSYGKSLRLFEYKELQLFLLALAYLPSCACAKQYLDWHPSKSSELLLGLSWMEI